MRAGRLGQDDIVVEGLPLERLDVGRFELVVEVAGHDVRLDRFGVDVRGLDPAFAKHIADAADHAGRLFAAADAVAQRAGLLRFEQVVQIGE